MFSNNCKVIRIRFSEKTIPGQSCLLPAIRLPNDNGAQRAFIHIIRFRRFLSMLFSDLAETSLEPGALWPADAITFCGKFLFLLIYTLLQFVFIEENAKPHDKSPAANYLL